jgi:BRCA1-associated protein
MPSYFYHITLELLTSSSSDITNDYDDSARLRSGHTLANDAVREAFLPFQRHSSKTKVPSHDRRRRHPDSVDATWGNNYITVGGGISSLNGFTRGQQEDLRSATTATNSSSANHSGADIEPDLRFSRISIQGVDMIALAHDSNSRSSSNAVQSKRSGYDNSATRDDMDVITTGIGTDILGGLHTRGKYIPLDQTLTESVFGIVHLYRDAKETPSLTVDDSPLYLKGSSAAARRPPNDQSIGSGDSSHSRSRNDADFYSSSHVDLPDNEECSTLCILAVPSYLSPADFLGFVGEGTRDEVSHFRMIKTARANRYMVLMKFRNGKKAREWQKEWNGKVFNSMEVCFSLTNLYTIYQFSNLTF